MTKFKILPRGKQVLVKPDGEESRTSKSGLSIPDSVEQEKKAMGTVIEVGPEIKDIKVGDHVLYGVFAGEQISFKESAGQIDYVLLFEEDILAFIEEEK